MSIEQTNINSLASENNRLKRALAALIPWAGKSAYGPSWATPEQKAINQHSFETAFREAVKCFPEDYIGPLDDEAATPITA
jgi:hypothetical protein